MKLFVAVLGFLFLSNGTFPLIARASSEPRAARIAGRAPAGDKIDIALAGRLAFRTFTDRDGLPQNSITSIVRDPRGYIWVGTQDGPAYFNGRRWIPVPLPNHVAAGYVRVIAVGSDGGLWFGTSGGLFHLKNNAWTMFDKSNGLPNNEIRAFLETVSEAGTQRFWIGTDGGLVLWENGTFTVYDTRAGLPDNSIRCLLETTRPDGSRVLWIGTRKGLASLENGRFILFDKSSGLSDDFVFSLAETVEPDDTRSLWVGTSNGLNRRKNGRWTTYTKQSGLPDDCIFTLLATRSDSGTPILWAGTAGEGLGRFENETWVRIGADSGLSYGVIWSLMETRSGSGAQSLWVGTAGGGLACLESGTWISYNRQFGLLERSVYAVVETVSSDGSSVFWFGTNRGLARFEHGRWSSLASGLATEDYVRALLVGKSATGGAVVWVGTQNGLDRIENGRRTRYTVEDGLLDNSVLCLAEGRSADGKPVVWIGTESGLVKFENNRFSTIDGPEATVQTAIRCLLETDSRDQARTLWVGTFNGLSALSNGRWTVFTAPEGPPNPRVKCLFEERLPSGGRTMWVGTHGGGAARFDPDRPGSPWTIFSDTSVPALPNNVVYRIFPDRAGALYFSTNKGVARLTPRSPTPDDAATYSVYTFTTENGLPSQECNTGASLTDRQGRVWVGTVEGAAMFDPKPRAVVVEPSPLQVERILLNGGNVFIPALQASETAGVIALQKEPLSHDQNNLEFEYSLLSYFRSSDIRYRTQLVGHDRDPSGWTTDAKREYTNLADGRYTFNIWAKDHLGTVSGPIRIVFSIRPAPWRTWWAYLSYVLAAVGVGYVGYRFRVATLRDRTRLLESVVRTRTAELAEKIDELKASEARAWRANEDALKAKNEALEASRAKSVFLATMSHELRTPLNAVLGFVQLMGRDRALNAEQREHLGIILRSGEHLLTLINDILSISKIEAGHLKLDLGAFDLHRLFNGLEELFRPRADAKRLALVFEIEPNVPSLVKGDEGKLRQVLINLVGNALKFTRKGTVTLRVGQSEDKTTFTVEDTGPGIAAEEFADVFEPFVQTRAGQQVKEGTGLGLAISRKFVRLMGGDIEIRSRVGCGTTLRFSIILPVAEELPTRSERPAVLGLAPRNGPCRVLVVDDKWENRTALAKLLNLEGFEIREAADGRQAVQTAAAWRPDLIWMDIRMPVMDGFEATRLIRELENGEWRNEKEKKEDHSSQDSSLVTHHSSRSCVIIALTAGAFEQDKAAMLKAGCDDFVSKPFQAVTIFDKMAEHLGLAYVYEDSKPSSAPPVGGAVPLAVEFVGLPESVSQSLQKAVLEGDVQSALALSSEIERTSPALGRELQKLLRRYQFDEIIELLEDARNPKAETG